MKKIFIVLALIIITSNNLLAQTTKITTAAPNCTGYDGNNYLGQDATITFVISNNKNSDILLTEIETFKSTAGPSFPANPAKFNLWYTATSLSGSPIVSSPVWIKLTPETPASINLVPGYNTIFTGLDFIIPANTTYRFALESLTGIAYSGGLAPGYASPSILTADSVSLVLGDSKINNQSVGYASSYPNSSYGDSWFTGSITFKSTIPCTSPPLAGTTVSPITDTCIDINFNLGLTGYSNGVGQSFQWQKSTNNVNWVNMLNDTVPAITTSQKVSTYYRCALTCSGNTAYSQPLQINTPVGISGNFTINAQQLTSGTNFATFSEAINYISCGVNGPVTFNVVPGSGPYNEKITIPFIGGTSKINTITFKGHGETIKNYNLTSNDLAIVTLNNSQHIILDSLLIDGSGGSYCWGILLTNNADSNTIRNCEILTGLNATGQFNYNGIVFNGSNKTLAMAGSNGSYNTIENNSIVGGSNSIYMFGNSTSNQNIGNVIKGNSLKDFGVNGVYTLYYPNGIVIKGNDFSRPSTAVSASVIAAVNISTGCANTIAENNKIHNLFDMSGTSANTANCINISANTTTGNENRVFNNLIYNLTGNSNLVGINGNASSGLQIYHNTIVFDDLSAVSGNSYGIAQNNGFVSNFNIRNNVVYVTRGGQGNQRCINFGNATSLISCNNNVLYINCPGNINAFLGTFGNTGYADLTAWRQVNNNAYDQQSVSTDPVFVNVSNLNFTPTAAATNDIGKPLNILTDINGNTRSVTNPDPGAYEFDISACNGNILAGLANATITNTCPNNYFGLELLNNSFGLGLTFQWQFSSDTVNWVNVGNALTAPQISLQQSSTNYYRCELKCNGGTPVYSSKVLISTPSYLSGSYTINNALPTSGTNFNSFTDAINSIKCGINGPVTFNVVKNVNPYSEHFTIPQITGTSSTNTLTINGNGATLLYTSNDNTNKTAIILNGADHVIIDSLIIDVSGGNYGYGIALINQADSNTIRHCTINCSQSITTQNSIGILINGSALTIPSSGNNGNYNNIISNTINGGYYSIYLYGNSSSVTQNTNNSIVGNVFKDMHTNAIYANYQSSGLLISDNDFSRPNRTTTASIAAVYLYTGCFNGLIEKNKVHNLFSQIPSSTQISYGFFIGTDPPAGKENRVINNLVYDMNGNGAVYGVFCTFGNNCKIYHNTVVLDDQATTTGAAFGIHNPVQSTGIEFKNNLVYISRKGTGNKYCISIGNLSSSFVSDNNILFIDPNTTGYVGTIQGTNFLTLNDWKLAKNSTLDQNSISQDPLFTGACDYKPTATSVDNIGAALGIATDIKGVIRSVGLPDAGAYEFGSILPVNLTNFTGEIRGADNLLSWVTDKEQNFKAFELQKAGTDKNFTTTTIIPSKNNGGYSTTKTPYSFLDKNVMPNTFYYRLKQIDSDGKYAYSNIVSIKRSGIANNINIYPNPTATQINIEFNATNSTLCKAFIYDIYGRVLLSFDIRTQTGNNKHSLNISNLSTGNYLLKLIAANNEVMIAEKIIKQ